MRNYLAAVLGALALAVAFTVGTSQSGSTATAASSDRAVLQELRKLNKELRTLNNRVGGSFGNGGLVDTTRRIVRNTQVVCEQYSNHQCEAPAR